MYRSPLAVGEGYRHYADTGSGFRNEIDNDRQLLTGVANDGCVQTRNVARDPGAAHEACPRNRDRVALFSCDGAINMDRFQRRGG